MLPSAVATSLLRDGGLAARYHPAMAARKVGRSALEKALVGPAGEHYVLYKLNRRGLLATLAPRNLPTVDVLVFNEQELVAATLQVKTRTFGADGGWHMSRKHESITAPTMFYAFVDLEPSEPVTYIIHSSRVALFVTSSHRAWLAAPGARGRAHQDSDVRRVTPRPKVPVTGFPDGWMDQYREDWDALLRHVSVTKVDAASGNRAAR